VAFLGVLSSHVLLTPQMGSIFSGISAALIFLFFPETRFDRNYLTGIEAEIASPEDGKGTSITNEIRERSPRRKNAFLEELKPWSGVTRGVSYLHLLLRPWPMILYPATIFGFLAYSSILAWLVCVLDTNSSIFQNPPYLMSPGINSLINIPAIIGILIGAYCGGGLTDKFVEWRARKNNGVFEPETRLIGLVLPFFLVPVGLLMYISSRVVDDRYGIGVERQTSWAVPFIGFGFINFGLAAIPAITMTYRISACDVNLVIDTYYMVSFEALVLVNAMKQLFSFGFIYGIIPWITLSGFQSAFGTMVGIQCGILLLGVPLWYWGKEIRHKSASWKVVMY
jgi:hypothetical protein